MDDARWLDADHRAFALDCQVALLLSLCASQAIVQMGDRGRGKHSNQSARSENLPRRVEGNLRFPVDFYLSWMFMGFQGVCVETEEK